VTRPTPHPTPKEIPVSIRTRAAGAALALVALTVLAGCSAGGGGGSSIFGGGAQPTVASKGGGSGATSGTSATKAPAAAAFDLTKIDPCQLFTKDAAVALVGTSLGDTADNKGGEMPSCTYQPDPTGPATAQATLNVGGGAQSYYDVDKNNAGHAFTDVPGLGTEGHLERQGIFWKAHDTWFSITMLRLVDDDHQFDQPLIDAAKAVAAKVG
jgi:hypothetical protein